MKGGLENVENFCIICDTNDYWGNKRHIDSTSVSKKTI